MFGTWHRLHLLIIWSFALWTISQRPPTSRGCRQISIELIFHLRTIHGRILLLFLPLFFAPFFSIVLYYCFISRKLREKYRKKKWKNKRDRIANQSFLCSNDFVLYVRIGSGWRRSQSLACTVEFVMRKCAILIGRQPINRRRLNAATWTVSPIGMPFYRCRWANDNYDSGDRQRRRSHHGDKQY